MPHIGRVIIEDNVWIGSNCCIDRGTLHNTIVGEGSKLDNLIHIAHNVQIGKNCVIAAQVGMMGSANIKDHVHVGGQAGIKDIVIEDYVVVTAKAGVTKNIPPSETVVGFPATNSRRFWKQLAKLNRITEQVKK